MKLSEKIIWPGPGSYVVAVSGGVDSIVLLDLLAAQAGAKNLHLQVAHFNHGWTEESAAYTEVVAAAAKSYGLPFHSGKAQVKANEAAARHARYDWLREIMRTTKADAIITAHHYDDLVETVALNLLRGTGRRGLTPFGSVRDVVRPLLAVTKSELIKYAQDHQLNWIEDVTNADTKFRRNAVRHELLPQLRQENPQFDQEFGAIIAEAAKLNSHINAELVQLITKRGDSASADVAKLRRLSLATLTELIVMMVNAARPGTELDRRTVEVLAVDIKTGRLRGKRELTNGLFADPAHDTVTIAFTP